MNLDICCRKCPKLSSGYIEGLIYNRDNSKWYLYRRQSGYWPGRKDCVELELDPGSPFFGGRTADDILKSPPDGWTRIGRQDMLSPTDGMNLEKDMWKIRLSPECECEFYAEHFMSDIKHEQRMRKWSEWNARMKERYGRRLKSPFE